MLGQARILHLRNVNQLGKNIMVFVLGFTEIWHKMYIVRNCSVAVCIRLYVFLLFYQFIIS